ncbi:Hint domain-containing protein [Paracoccus sp. PS-1]|uniref:Hint domain-containing protein n=1 Tax=unclassified Paracoccus (in: a-proteobacteria) TaxID=2688777 RepID=UPI00048F8758|nr:MULTISPECIES: Hint domain-containing protein [unclassified Paracoccus (in: a-proteobacteria)]MDQ7263418.1 Hint domain-containing protein [Paracoccus sp. PS1]
MEYRIITATFGTQVPNDPGATGSDKYLPFLNRRDIDFSQADMAEIRIEDDDPAFGYLSRGGSGSFYDDPGSEGGQSLAESASFGHGAGAQMLAAGQRISLQDAAILRDAEGNEFYVTFPTYVDYDITGYPIEIGDRHTVLIIPRQRQDADGQSHWPQFRQDALYQFVGSYKIGIGQTSLPYDQTVKAPPCFTPGTLIETGLGPRPVETLAAGDLVLTRDHGLRPLRWIGGPQLDPARLDLQPNLRPILIAGGALGPGLPARDLVVSPQHRILLRSAIARRMFGTEEILVAARQLTALPGIRPLHPAGGVTYLHLLFDRHELVLSNGCWTESLLTGPQALIGLSSAARREIFALFPGLPDGAPTPARVLATGREGRRLIQRHLKNSRAFLPA